MMKIENLLKLVINITK